MLPLAAKLQWYLLKKRKSSSWLSHKAFSVDALWTLFQADPDSWWYFCSRTSFLCWLRELGWVLGWPIAARKSKLIPSLPSSFPFLSFLPVPILIFDSLIFELPPGQ